MDGVSLVEEVVRILPANRNTQGVSYGLNRAIPDRNRLARKSHNSCRACSQPRDEYFRQEDVKSARPLLKV